MKYCILEWGEKSLYINLVGPDLWWGPLGTLRMQWLDNIMDYFLEFLVGMWIVVGSDSE